MRIADAMGRLASWCAEHARVVVVAATVIAIAAALGATQLETEAGTDTLVDDDSASFAATEEVRERFGEDPVVIVAEGKLTELVLTENLGRLLRLEGCIAGRVPEGLEPLPGACEELAELQPARIVSGPATFLNQAVIGIEQAFASQIQSLRAESRAASRAAAAQVAAEGGSEAAQQQAAEDAAAAVAARFQQTLLQVASRYGLTRLPRIDDPLFVSQVVFDTRQGPGTPKARLSYLFPNADSAQIIVRLRPDLSETERERALELIRTAVSDETPRAECAGRNGKPAPCFKLDRAGYVISGAPVVVAGLASVLSDALLILFIAAVALMAIALFAVFRSRLRLLPLALALAAAAVTYGLVGLFGGSLTMASVAVLPVLIGLAVDYAIQLQARFDEAVADGAGGVEAARIAATRAGPVIVVACLATAAGFAALVLSPVPMVRSFGLMLIAGIVIALAFALTAGLAALALRARRPSGERPEFLAGPREAVVARTAPLGRSASEFGRGALALAIARPGRVLAVASALALCGWIAGTQTETVSDVRDLVPQDLREVRDLDRVQTVTGVSGELDVLVETDDLTDPALIAWMAGFKTRVLEAGGFVDEAGGSPGEFASCASAEICPGPAVSDFITNPELGVERARIEGLFAALPEYDLQAVISADGDGGGAANVAFGIRAMPLDEQLELIEAVRRQVDPPGIESPLPEGVEVQVAGLPVLAAESNDALAESRYWLTIAGLLAVALALLLIYRSPGRALVPLIPIVLATGWSSLVLAAMGIPLNPMSATLGALVIAISTEFSVILSSRYREQRESGQSVGEALRRAYSRTGAAVLASGITAIAGFAALVASDIQMLRDFGFVTVVDLGVALAGVMLVLPAALVWAEAGFELPRLSRRRPLPAQK